MTRLRTVRRHTAALRDLRPAMLICLLVLAATALGSYPSPALGAVMEPLSMDELARAATSIVIAEAESVEPRAVLGADGAATLESIKTDVDLRIAQMLKGPAYGRAQVSVAGGRLDDIGYLATWEPVFRRGERAILFLDEDGRVMGPQAKLTIRDGRVPARNASVTDVMTEILGAAPLGPMAGERPDRVAVSATLPESATQAGASFILPAVTATHVDDGFESGAISSPLTVYDGDPDGDLPPDWTATTERAADGSWSAYCDDSVAPGGPYSTDVYSWIWAGPFDLSGATSAFLEYSMWTDTETDDTLGVTFSTGDDNGDGLLDFSGFVYQSSTLAWVDQSIDLGNIPATGENMIGEPEVWFAFIFSSDGVSNAAEGVYLDDILLVEDPDLPTITDITPGEGSAGTDTEITITGTDFGASQGSGVVEFTYDEMWGTTIEGDITSWSDTQITCIIPIVTDLMEYPGAASTGPVTVTNDTGATSAGYGFDVTFAYGGIKWAQPFTGYTFNDNTSDTTQEEALFDAGAETWNGVSRFEFRDDGPGTATNYLRDGENQVFWTSTALPSSTLAAAGIWYGEPEGAPWEILEIDIGFNDDKLWGDGTGGSYDIQSIAVHELGHWLNLRDLYGTGDSDKIMYGYGSSGSVKRTLEPADILGAQWIYGPPTLSLDVAAAPAPAVPGQMVTYTYTLTNESTLTASVVSIDDSAFGTVATVPTLAPSASLVATYAHAFGSVGLKTNDVIASATIDGTAAVAATDVDVLVAVPTVQLTVSASDDPAEYGDSVDMHYRIRNTGIFTLSGLVISDSGRTATETVGWDLGPGQSRTYSVSVDADGPIHSDASVTGWYAGTSATDAATALTVSTYERISGSDRVNTAVAASKRAFPIAGSVDTVVVASAYAWADALPAAGLAGAADGPLLLVSPTSLPSAVRSEITRLGADKVYIAGGTGVVSEAVGTALDSMSGVSVERLGGSDRFDTARKIATEMLTLPGVTPDTAFVATGRDFPDALAASSLAAAMPAPILLCDTDTLPSSTRAALSSLSPDTIVVAGGTAVVSPDVETALGSYASSVVRRAGADRYSTARSVVLWGEGVLAPGGPTGVYLAVGTNYPDALAGGVVAAAANGSWNPLMLTPATSLSGQVSSYISSRASIEHVGVLGGTAAVSSSVMDAAKGLLP